jgi:uncharacterized OB-fold protein
MTLSAVSLYRPTWLDAAGARCTGGDEDEVTMAVAALRPLVEAGHVIERIVLVTRRPALLEGDTAAVVAHAIGLPQVPVEEVLGGAPAVVDVLLSSTRGTAVVAIEPEAHAGAGAMLLGDGGAALTGAGSVRASLPLSVRRTDESSARTYDDPRLLRELGWKPALRALAGDGVNIAVGVPAAMQRSPGYDPALSDAVGASGTAAVPFALGLLAEQTSGRLVAVEQASASALDVEGSASVLRTERLGVPKPVQRQDGEADIPISLAAYARAFEEKVGFLAGRCETCGTLSYPSRYRCLGCGAEGPVPLAPLPRQATVYTVITVRVPVPGLASPYSLAIVELDGLDVRMLVQVADAPPGSAAIDDPGTLVFRKVADRQGIPDYGYAFQPRTVRSLEVAS